MLKKFFNPRSVAIIGASHTPGKIGYSILENFVKGKYKGKIYPINPKKEPILGKKVYSSIKDIEDNIDLAVIAIPSKSVPIALRECAEKKVKSVIIVSGGFSEIGSEGKILEEELKKIIKGKKTRVMGPNCLGVLDTSTRVDTIFNPIHKLKRPEKGEIGIITQSGAVGVALLDKFSEMGIGISKFISYENAVDIDECDALEYLSKDKKTSTILLFIEAVKNGKRFIKIAKKVSKKKPIIVLKGGKTEYGRKAALSHTGSMVGSREVYSAAFKQVGIVEAESFEELLDFSNVFCQPIPKGNRIAIITNGGGFGVLACDEAEKQGINILEPSEKLKSKLKKFFPKHVGLNNPIDLTGDVDSERYRIAIEEVLKSGEYDGIIVIILFQVPALEEDVVDVICKLQKKYKKTILVCISGGTFTDKAIKKFGKNRIPVYFSPERAVKAMGVLIKYSRMRRA